MKKILLALALMMGAICVNAQEHLKFKGVPIDGTLESFTRQLEAKGYTREAYGGDVQVMKGDFAGKSNCMIYIASVKTRDLTYLVLVNFKKQTSWNSLRGDYMQLKNMLNQKYGQPTVEREEFTRSHIEGYEMHFLDECQYNTVYQFDEGGIMLSISEEGHVVLGYFDRINSEINDNAAMNDL